MPQTPYDKLLDPDILKVAIKMQLLKRQGFVGSITSHMDGKEVKRVVITENTTPDSLRLEDF